MALIPFQKLARFTITPYDKPDLSGTNGNAKRVKKDTFEAQYNPTTFSFTHGQTVVEKPNVDPKRLNDVQSLNRKNGTFSVELFFDGTGASPSGGILPGILGAVVAVTGEVVSKQISKFYETVLMTDKDLHEARAVLVTWGGHIRVACKLQSATTNYQLFDKSGDPLRATINASFLQIYDPADPLEASLPGMKSADVTKLYMVKAGDTIYNISKQEYGDESLYLQIAETNDLKNYRKLTPGQQLILPSVKGA